MEKIGAHDGETQGSGSGSGYSDLSALENETDDFGRRLLQHQRDVQRINHALHGHQPFRKARPSAPLSERLELGGIRDEIFAAREHERTGSSGSADSDPPLNIPRTWGRKGRVRHDWLRKIYAPSDVDLPPVNGHEKEQELTSDEGAIFPHRTAYTGDEEMNGLADDALPSVEDDGTPPSMRRRRLASSPTSLRHMNTTLQAIDTDDQDFSTASLLASTPAARRRIRKIDELTRREIETVERRGVTKRTLGQIFEQSAQEVAADSRPVSAPALDALCKGGFAANKENLQPTAERKSKNTDMAETRGLAGRTAQAVTFKNAQRPAHRRNDSMNLLKQLARVSSMSPSPAKDKDVMDVPKTRTKSEPAIDAGPLSAKSINSDFIADSKPPKTETGGSAPSDKQRTAGSEPHEPRSMKGPSEIDVTPVPEDAPHAAKTPVVTGAWFDTPRTNTDLRPLLQTTDSTIQRAFGTPSGSAALDKAEDELNDGIQRIKSEPAHAKSALADVLQNDKSQVKPEYGEATVMSLEDIVNPDLDPTDPTVTADMEEMIQQVQDQLEADDSLSQAEKDRRQERLAIEAMNKHLRAARTSIKDADRGLRRVENRMETETAQPSFHGPPLASSHDPTPVALHYGRTQCQHCGGTYYGSIWHALWVELRSCFYTFDDTSSHLPRLTWLGLVCALWLVWWITESTLCEIYCMPRYATHMIDYGTDPDAPLFPFVIPTLMFRPVEWAWRWWTGKDLWDVLLNWYWAEPEPVLVRPASGKTFRRAVSDVVGNSAGVGWAATATMSSARVTQSFVEALDEIGRMWDDEVLN